MLPQQSGIRSNWEDDLLTSCNRIYNFAFSFFEIYPFDSLRRQPLSFNCFRLFFDKFDATLSLYVLLWMNFPKIYFPRKASIWKYRNRNRNIKKLPEKCPTTIASNAPIMEMFSCLVAWKWINLKSWIIMNDEIPSL